MNRKVGWIPTFIGKDLIKHCYPHRELRERAWKRAPSIGESRNSRDRLWHHLGYRKGTSDPQRRMRLLDQRRPGTDVIEGVPSPMKRRWLVSPQCLHHIYGFLEPQAS